MKNVYNPLFHKTILVRKGGQLRFTPLVFFDIFNRIPECDAWVSCKQSIEAVTQSIRQRMVPIESNFQGLILFHQEIPIDLEDIAHQSQHSIVTNGRPQLLGCPHQKIVSPFG